MFRALLALIVLTASAQAAPAPKAKETPAYFPTKEGDKREYEIRDGEKITSAFTDIVTKVVKRDGAIHVTINCDYLGSEPYVATIALTDEGVPNDLRSPITRPKPKPKVPKVAVPGAGDEPLPIPLGYLPPIPRSRHLPKTVAFGIVGAELLGVGAVVICLLNLIFGNGGLPFGMFAPDKEPDLLAWVPPDSEIVIGIDLKELTENAEFRALLKDSDFAKSSDDGITWDIVDKIIVSGRAPPPGAFSVPVRFEFRGQSVRPPCSKSGSTGAPRRPCSPKLLPRQRHSDAHAPLEEAGEILQITPRQAQQAWQRGKLWLKRRLKEYASDS